jgi:anti-sigma regulatory factor (Ser/Thr protein kinase)
LDRPSRGFKITGYGNDALNETGRTLTFSELDGLAFAAERGRLDTTRVALVAADLGPLFELGLLAKSGRVPWPGRSGWLALDGVSPLLAALSRRQHQWICPNSRSAGVYRLYGTPPPGEPRWVEFGVAAQYAATGAGFTSGSAAQLVGAIGELQSNIYEHSRSSHTGLVAFRGKPGHFEFVVCDRGVGVLESLRSCAEFVRLTDHGEALQLALADGVSRHGTDKGRGKGFHPLLTGLANMNGSLRFRSGDHALTMDGHNPASIPAKLGQKPFIEGFFISVSCSCQ